MRVIADDHRSTYSMATLEKSDIDQCASCRDCTLEANSTQASFDLCAYFPISRSTDCTGHSTTNLKLKWAVSQTSEQGGYPPVAGCVGMKAVEGEQSEVAWIDIAIRPIK